MKKNCLSGRKAMKKLHRKKIRGRLEADIFEKETKVKKSKERRNNSTRRFSFFSTRGEVMSFYALIPFFFPLLYS